MLMCYVIAVLTYFVVFVMELSFGGTMKYSMHVVLSLESEIETVTS